MHAVQWIRNRHFYFLDLALLTLGVYISYTLRLESFDFARIDSGFFFFTALALVVVPAVFYFFGVYARYWIYASVGDMLVLVTAVAIAVAICGSVSLIALSVLPTGTLELPRSIPFIFFPMALGLTAAPRFALRVYAQHVREHSKQQASTPAPQRVLVVGAGDAGTMIVREVQRNPALGMHVIGFVDDDPRKNGTRILGVPVLGNRRAITQLSAERHIDLVIIAMPTAAGKDIRDIVRLCEQSGVKTKTMPGIYEVLSGHVSVSQLRSVQIEDLLRREPVLTDIDAVRALLADRCVLVTGGGGSIGSELCRQILRAHPSMLVVLGHGENSIFEICSELRRQQEFESRLGGNGQRAPTVIQPVIADIRFPDRLRAILTKYRPDIVFHAAAHKHVPLMEENPTEAVSNNVLGTRNLLEAAAACGVERFVMISTDKAVKPTSVMGASKRVAELLVHHTAAKIKRPYVAVRFGNVLGSRGSVVLTFKQQIAQGGPITITHPDMKRFFMTIPEAVQLVLQAAALGQGGEVFMLDMGEPVKIVDLARDLIELSGLEVGRDIDIVFTGVRPGEKLHEELFVPGETYERTRHEKIYVIGNANGFIPARLDQIVSRLEQAVQCQNEDDLLATLHDLLPRYQARAANAALADAADRQPTTS